MRILVPLLPLVQNFEGTFYQKFQQKISQKKNIHKNKVMKSKWTIECRKWDREAIEKIGNKCIWIFPFSAFLTENIKNVSVIGGKFIRFFLSVCSFYVCFSILFTVHRQNKIYSTSKMLLRRFCQIIEWYLMEKSDLKFFDEFELEIGWKKCNLILQTKHFT